MGIFALNSKIIGNKRIFGSYKPVIYFALSWGSWFQFPSDRVLWQTVHYPLNLSVKYPSLCGVWSIVWAIREDGSQLELLPPIQTTETFEWAPNGWSALWLVNKAVKFQTRTGPATGDGKLRTCRSHDGDDSGNCNERWPDPRLFPYSLAYVCPGWCIHIRARTGLSVFSPEMCLFSRRSDEVVTRNLTPWVRGLHVEWAAKIHKVKPVNETALYCQHVDLRIDSNQRLWSRPRAWLLWFKCEWV